MRQQQTIEKKKRVKIRYLAIAIWMLILISILTSIVIDANYIRINSISIGIPKLPEEFQGYQILQLSDLHSATFGNNNDYVVQKIRQQDPDLIVMTGDMVNATDENFDVLLNLVDQLKQQYPILYIFGNHEMDLKKKLPTLVAELQKRDVTILDNTKREITRENEKIAIYGLNYELSYYAYRNNKKQLTKQIVESKIGKADPSQTNILLTHNPRYFEVYQQWGADLTLTGHTHAGVVRIPFIGGIVSPERRLFPTYIEGTYTWGNSNMIVNRGMGFGRIPIRIFNMPEMVLITLEKQG